MVEIILNQKKKKEKQILGYPHLLHDLVQISAAGIVGEPPRSVLSSETQSKQKTRDWAIFF